MKLTPMRFKNYTWPHNPETCRVEMERKVAVQKVPFGGCVLQDLGLVHRVMRGEGVFAGASAYEEFRKLAQVFEEKGSGVLVHPVWRTMRACFVALEMLEEPRPDYVRYAFEFREDTGSVGMTSLPRENDKETGSGAVLPGNGIVWPENGSIWPESQPVWPENEPVETEREPVQAEAAPGAYHTVVKGDTLWGIGKRYGVSLSSLIRMNPQIKNPNLIYPGNEVRVR